MILNSFRFPSGAPPFSFGNALDFSLASNNYVDTGQTANESVFTLSFWVKFNTSVVGTITGTDFNNNVYMGQTSATIFLIDTGSVNLSFTTTSASLVINTWYHYMIDFNGSGTSTLYIDSVSMGGVVATGRTMRLSYIGNRLNLVNNLDGIIDEFAFWSATSSTSQNAIDLYNGGSGVDAASVISSPTLYYHLNESGTDTTAVDSSGNGNDGTLINFPTSGMWVPH